MRMVGTRRQLWNEQCRDEKSVLREFKDPSFAVRIPANDTQPCFVQRLLILRVQLEIAVVLLERRFAAVDGLDTTARLDLHLHFLSDERTGQRRYEEVRSVGVVLCMRSVLEAQNISGVFDHDMLAPSYPEAVNRARGRSELH